jgi:hypothetical protein
MTSRLRLGRRQVLGIAAALVAPSCGGDAALVPVTAQPIDPAVIDRDPLVLLPSGAVGLAGADARALFGTPLGGDVANVIRELVPLGPDANFEPHRDVDRVTAGFYAMQGVDLCAVVQGRFDAAAIERAADARKVMPSGKSIVKTRYAEQTLFTAGNLGFTVLTPRTMLSGNEIGMRRALDRLRYQSGSGPFPVLERGVAKWMLDLIETPNASFAFAGDFSVSSTSVAMRETVPFIAGLERARVIGNFASPGLNFAGTLSYKDDAAATAGGSMIQNLSSVGQLTNLLTQVMMGATVPPVQVRQSGKDLAFTTSMDSGTSLALIRLVGDAAKSSL